MRFLLRLALALLALSAPALADASRVDLGERFYLIDLPARAEGAPVILALHGGGGGPRQFARDSRLGPAGTAQGYAVIFPAGSSRRGAEAGLTWNGGYCCGWAQRQGVDDTAFLDEVVADAVARFGLDGRRVFVTGMSNGAILAEIFAAQSPGRVRAVAGVAGTMDTSQTPVEGPVPALVIHGTADSRVPYEGGEGRGPAGSVFAPVAAVVKAFLDAQPGPLARTTRRIDAKDDGTAVVVTDWSVSGKVRVRLLTVEGGEHHWPGARKARLATGKTREIDANTEILRFFAQYR